MPPSSECLTSLLLVKAGARQPHDLSIPKSKGVFHTTMELSPIRIGINSNDGNSVGDLGIVLGRRGGSSLDSENYCGDDENLYGSITMAR